MPIISVVQDPEALTLTIVADFPVPVRRLWDTCADPRQIEKWWGPPGWPATFTRHDMAVGGRSAYVMTGPEGERAGGYWEFLAVEAPRFLEVRDGFADDEGEPNTQLPTMRMVYDFEETDEGSRLTATTYFGSLEQLEQLVEMGMEEGTRAAMDQIDDVLADLASFAAGRTTEAQILDDTTIRVSRVIRGTVEQVWQAHHEAELLQRWLLGPDGWSMPVCELASGVGDDYRYEWEAADGSGRFGFVGKVLESSPPHREVTTEAMLGMEGPGTVNEMTLTEIEGGTLLALVITYPDSDVRDTVLGTGMTDGMETSYARLEREVLAGV